MDYVINGWQFDFDRMMAFRINVPDFADEEEETVAKKPYARWDGKQWDYSDYDIERRLLRKCGDIFYVSSDGRTWHYMWIGPREKELNREVHEAYMNWVIQKVILC